MAVIAVSERVGIGVDIVGFRTGVVGGVASFRDGVAVGVAGVGVGVEVGVIVAVGTTQLTCRCTQIRVAVCPARASIMSPTGVNRLLRGSKSSVLASTLKSCPSRQR